MSQKNEFAPLPYLSRVLPKVLGEGFLGVHEIVALFSSTPLLWDVLLSDDKTLAIDLSHESPVSVEWLMETFKQGADYNSKRRKESRNLLTRKRIVPANRQASRIFSGLKSCIMLSAKLQVRSVSRVSSNSLVKVRKSSTSSQGSVPLPGEVHDVGIKQVDVKGVMKQFRGHFSQIVGVHIKGVEVDVEEEGMHDLNRLFAKHISPDVLVSVRLSQSPAISNLHQFSVCRNLERLDCRGCPKLVNLGGIGECVKLQHLNLSGCGELTNISAVSTLVNLKVLYLDACKKLSSIQAIASCKDLRELSVNFLERVSSVGSARNCPKLKTLSMAGYEDFESLAYLRSLEDLDLSFSDDLEDLHDLKNNTKLLALKLAYCEDLTDISGVETLTSLRKLTISRCQLLNNISDLEMLKDLTFLNCAYSEKVNFTTFRCRHLVELDVSNCPQITSASEVAGPSKCQGLKRLNFADCENLRAISALKYCQGLEWLNLSGCPIQSLKPVTSNCKQLQYIDLSCCYDLYKVNSLSKCVLLRQVSLAGCVNVKDIRKLRKLEKMVKLDLSECIGIPSVLPSFVNLRDLNLSFCDQIEDIKSLQQMNHLEVLQMRGCQADELAEAVKHCKELKHLNLTSYGTSALNSLTFLQELPNLEFVSISDCEAKDKMIVVSQLLARQCKVEY